ncbi:RNA polymerase sigma factor [Chitinophaga sp. ARDCPP14]|uniref:RNA polymerase sigma factor n=1 Tax=Chitinophaga sp. ARDCPP14 TaxID=3391139 RepID=UPI003F51CA7D
MVDEKELIPVILKGDLHAFEILVKEYQRLVFFIAGKIVTNREEVEDVCQEVFIKVYRHLGSFKFQSKLSTWIARIAWVTAVNHNRKQRREHRQKITEIETIEQASENPEELLDRKDVAAYLNQLIDQMPEQYRTVIVLYHLNEFSYEEITQITGMPLGTIKSYLFRARKLLKDKLTGSLKKDIV